MTAPAMGPTRKKETSAEGGVDAERGAAIVFGDALDGFNADGGKDEREAEASEGRAGEGHPRRVRLPQQQQSQRLDGEAGHGHRESAEAVDGLDEEQARHDEGRAEGGEAKRGAGPVAAGVEERNKGGQDAVADSAQRQAHAVRRHAAQHVR